MPNDLFSKLFLVFIFSVIWTACGAQSCMMGYIIGLILTITISNKLLLVFTLPVIWVACGAQACMIGYTVELASKITMQNRPPGGKSSKLLANAHTNVGTGQQQTLAFLCA